MGRLQQRQSGGSTATDCYFYVIENNSTGNYTLYSLDVSQLSTGQSINFNASSFVPGNGTTISYVESCPPNATYVQLNVTGLQDVVTPPFIYVTTTVVGAIWAAGSVVIIVRGSLLTIICSLVAPTPPTLAP